MPVQIGCALDFAGQDTHFMLVQSFQGKWLKGIDMKIKIENLHTLFSDHLEKAFCVQNCTILWHAFTFFIELSVIYGYT